MSNTADIVKIQKSIRKSVKDFAIAGNCDEEALIVLVSAALYLAMGESEVPPAPRAKRNPTSEPNASVI